MQLSVLQGLMLVNEQMKACMHYSMFVTVYQYTVYCDVISYA